MASKGRSDAGSVGPLSEDIQGHDERVNLDLVRRATKTLALFIADWRGLHSTR